MISNSVRVTENEPMFDGSWICKIRIPPKNQMFIWVVMHNSIQVFFVLMLRGIDINATFILCNSHEETLIHLLQDCPTIITCLTALGIPDQIKPSFTRETKN